jgi:uncharacterized protein
MIIRDIYSTISDRIQETRRKIQVITGPRQIGKTTAIGWALKQQKVAWRYCTCDDPAIHDRFWLESEWAKARTEALQKGECILAIDELQKIPNWSEVVKRLWDEDGIRQLNLKVVLLGSSALLLQRGLTESLAGRFETLHMNHWSFSEMQNAFDWDLDTYIHFGGYPGAAPFVTDSDRWKSYVGDSIIESTLARDVLLLERIDKPALLRQLFTLGCAMSGQIVSLRKLSGQLQDSGTLMTISHYLRLLEQGDMLAGLQKHHGRLIRTRTSTPKFQVLDNAFMAYYHGKSVAEARSDPALWGRFVESAVGAHLFNGLKGTAIEVLYWRDVDKEVDFVIRSGDTLLPIEVKSGRRKGAIPGLADFSGKFGAKKSLIVGEGGMPLEEFLRTPPKALI